MSDSEPNSNSNTYQECKGNKYPLNEYYMLIDCHDVIRTNNKIIAFLVVDDRGTKKIRFYAWRKKGDSWKVDLARVDTRGWDFENISQSIAEFKKKHMIV